MDGPVPRRPTARRGLDRLRFALERLVLRGVRYRLLLAASVVVLVALVAGALVALLDGGFSEPGDAVWWAFLRLTDPGYLGDDEGIARRSVSTVVTVLGYVLFLGLLIAILTQWLNDAIRKLESGVTPVAASDHVVVLGWTHRTPTIVEELLRTRARVQRFLARREARELRIVILAEHVDEALALELRVRLGELWNDRQILLRSGTPLRLDHLERVAFRDAAVLILPGADFAERNPDAVDAQTVKTLTSVSTHAGESGSVPPLAVAELSDARRAGVARRAYQGDSEIVAGDEMISRLIAQSVRQPGLRAVFSELLTLGEGNALYVRQLEERAGTKFGDLRGAFPRAIPLGIVRLGDGQPVLDLDPESVLGDEDLLVFVATSFDDCVPQATRRPGAPASPPAPLRSAPERRRRVLILGWSRKVPGLLAELRRYGKGAFEIDVLSSTPVDERERALVRHGFTLPESRVRQHEAGFTVPGVLERLEPQRYDHIVLMASERLAEEEQADAASVFAYQILRGLLPEEGPRPELFVELLDQENQFLFPRDQVDVIVSPLLVSYLLSQVSLRRELAAVFGELSRAWGAQIVLQPAREYLGTNGPVRFGDLESAAAARGEVALGLRCTRGSGTALALNPDRDAEWSFAPDDQVVVLTSYTEPEGAA
jgi:hypothetical protein